MSPRLGSNRSSELPPLAATRGASSLGDGGPHLTPLVLPATLRPGGKGPATFSEKSGVLG